MGNKKWRPLKSKDVRKVLIKHGFVKKGQVGSHEQWEGYVKGERMVVTVPDYRQLESIDLIKSIVAQSGLGRGAFYKN